MNSQLTREQQKAICSQLGRVKLQLLYKASVHGFTGAAFHQRCDNQGPTVSVGFNATGHVFGGYTRQGFSQSGQYVCDDQAFVFTLQGEKLLQYPVTTSAYAVKMVGNCGPYFGEALVLIYGSQAVVYSGPGNYYTFNAAEMHGNDLNMTECEVYQVQAIPQLVLMTKVDEVCPFVAQDIRNIYKSGYIKEVMQETSARLGVPLSCVIPVKNYSQELELDPDCDILLLSAVIQMLRFADNYFDELSDRLRNIET
ncbi:uncharacterized protein LOC114854151 isoform X2 [Betta splendens]|nr:uncharacterized protein LOC114854151 isoform X2 [Betta splendens]